jgi:hypothetical protein
LRRKSRTVAASKSLVDNPHVYYSTSCSSHHDDNSSTNTTQGTVEEQYTTKHLSMQKRQINVAHKPDQLTTSPHQRAASASSPSCASHPQHSPLREEHKTYPIGPPVPFAFLSQQGGAEEYVVNTCNGDVSFSTRSVSVDRPSNEGYEQQHQLERVSKECLLPVQDDANGGEVEPGQPCGTRNVVLLQPGIHQDTQSDIGINSTSEEDELPKGILWDVPVLLDPFDGLLFQPVAATISQKNRHDDIVNEIIRTFL